jgi:DNA-binding GntR family transcriptional regulator
MLINKASRPNATHTDIVTYYADRINDGGIRVGEKLPTIHATAKKFKMSPTSAAKAFTQLQVLGYVESNGKGTYVIAAGPMRLYRMLGNIMNELQDAGESPMTYAGDLTRPPRIVGTSGAVAWQPAAQDSSSMQNTWVAQETA